MKALPLLVLAAASPSWSASVSPAKLTESLRRIASSPAYPRTANAKTPAPAAVAKRLIAELDAPKPEDAEFKTARLAFEAELIRPLLTALPESLPEDPNEQDYVVGQFLVEETTKANEKADLVRAAASATKIAPQKLQALMDEVHRLYTYLRFFLTEENAALAAKASKPMREQGSFILLHKIVSPDEIARRVRGALDAAGIPYLAPLERGASVAEKLRALAPEAEPAPAVETPAQAENARAQAALAKPAERAELNAQESLVKSIGEALAKALAKGYDLSFGFRLSHPDNREIPAFQINDLKTGEAFIIGRPSLDPAEQDKIQLYFQQPIPELLYALTRAGFAVTGTEREDTWLVSERALETGAAPAPAKQPWIEALQQKSVQAAVGKTLDGEDFRSQFVFAVLKALPRPAHLKGFTLEERGSNGLAVPAFNGGLFYQDDNAMAVSFDIAFGTVISLMIKYIDPLVSEAVVQSLRGAGFRVEGHPQRPSNYRVTDAAAPVEPMPSAPVKTITPSAVLDVLASFLGEDDRYLLDVLGSSDKPERIQVIEESEDGVAPFLVMEIAAEPDADGKWRLEYLGPGDAQDALAKEGIVAERTNERNVLRVHHRILTPEQAAEKVKSLNQERGS